MSIKSGHLIVGWLVVLALICGHNSRAAGDQIEIDDSQATRQSDKPPNSSTRIPTSSPHRNFTTTQLQQQQQQQQLPRQAQASSRTSTPAVNNVFYQQPRSSSQVAANLVAVRQHWRQMENSLGSSLFEPLGEQLRLQLKGLFANSSASSGCKLALNEVANSIGDGSLWANQMLDASAKLPSGLLDGTLTELGNYDGCLAIRWAPASVQGQYCTVSIKPHLIGRPRLHTACQRLPSFSASPTGDKRNGSLFRWISQNSQQFYYAGLRLGICTPHRCSRNDLQQLLNNFLAKFDLLGQVKGCQTSPTVGRAELQRHYLINLEHFDSGQKIVIFALLALIGLSLVGTLLDCLHSPKATQRRATTTTFQMMRQQPPRRWQYQVYQRDTNLNKCNECAHSALADNLALWTSGKRTKEDPLLACPVGATPALKSQAAVGLDYVCSVHHDNDRDDDDDGERDESWIVKLEQQIHQKDNNNNNNSSRRDDRPRSAILTLRLLECFSLRHNLKTIGKQVPSASTSESDSHSNGATRVQDIKVIHGLRTLTMIWIIFGHTIGLVNPEMMNNLFALAQLSCSSRLLQALLNATLAVNTFFMISGVVTMISLFRRCQSVANLVTASPATDNRCKATAHRQHQSKAKRLDSLSSASQVGANCGEDSISIASSSQSSGVSSNRRCIHNNNNNNNLSKQETPIPSATESTFLGLPSDFRPFMWLLMRYLRLTPTYATVIGLSILMPALGDGPFWPETAGQLGSACKQNWHLNLAYLNNLIETDKLCLIHSWYLSNDWQFFLLTLLLLGLAYKSRRLALLLAVSLAAASMAATFAVTVIEEFPPTIVTTSPAVAERWQFIHQLYYKPWPHLNSYLVGLLVGYLLLAWPAPGGTRDKKSDASSDRWRLLCVSLLVTCLGALLLSSIYPWNMGHHVDPILTGLHSATFRTLWAACCGWLVFTLARRPHLWLAKLLAWPGFQLTSRLTYCTYLIHPLVIYYHFGTMRERLDSSMYAQFNRFLATLGLSYLMALLLSLLVESPSIRLQHLLSGSSRSSGAPPLAASLLSSLSSTSSSSDPQPRTSISSGSSATSESAATTTTDSWLVGPQQPAGSDHPAAGKHVNLEQLQQQVSAGVTAQQQAPPPPPPPQPPTAGTALDGEFQRKLAQAIGRGFRIRSRMAAGSSPAARSSLALIQNPLQKLHAAQEDRHQGRRAAPQPLATFAYVQSPELAESGRPQPVDLSARRRLSSDEIAKFVGSSTADRQPEINNNSQCSLNDLIQMRRKFLSQRSHSNVRM